MTTLLPSSLAIMQVAKKALRREPACILRSANSVEHHLQSIQQLTDPPLDLNTALHGTSLLRGSAACCVRMAQWLRTNLQLSEKELRHYLSRRPSILGRSLVNISFTERARSELSRPISCGGSLALQYSWILVRVNSILRLA